MSKKNKGFDVITEAHERANHNINPYYWINRVTSYQVAQWRIWKMLSPIFFVFYTLLGYLMLSNFNKIATEQNQTFFSTLFDFTDSATTARFVAFLFFSFYWVVLAIGTIQNILQFIFAPPPPEQEVRKEKKKKQPKRPKNYK
jgi:accessory gene regulator protein AgrB